MDNRSHYLSADRLAEKTIEVADKLGKHPRKVTVRDMVREGIPERNLSAYGPWQTFKRARFTPDPHDLRSDMGHRYAQSYIYKLEKTIGTANYISDRLLSALERAVSRVERLPPPANLPTQQDQNHVVAAVFSDSHIGYDVDKREVPGHAWDKRIAARRIGLFAHDVAGMRGAPEESTLQLLLGGDILAGDFRLDDSKIRKIVDQAWEAKHYLQHLIAYEAQHYSAVYVDVVPGNHDRIEAMGPGRLKVEKWNSYTTFIYLWLRDVFEDWPNVHIRVTRAPWVAFELCGHNYVLAHGDTDLATAAASSVIKVKDQRAMLAELSITSFDGKLDALILGHYHTPTYVNLPIGIDLVVNGNVDGANPYAATLGFRHKDPRQVAFRVNERHPVYGFTAFKLSRADEDPRYESVVPVPPDWDRGS